MKVSKKEPSIVPAYRMLVEIHRMSSDIVELERQCGKVVRETKDLRNQCDNERKQKSAKKVDRLTKDLMLVRQENKALRMELKTRERKAAAAAAAAKENN